MVKNWGVIWVVKADVICLVTQHVEWVVVVVVEVAVRDNAQELVLVLVLVLVGVILVKYFIERTRWRN